MLLDDTQPSDSVHEVQYQLTQRVPHLYKGTCMLASEIKVIGTVEGAEDVTISINCLCPLSVVEEMCDALRNGLNNMGSGINFEIYFKDLDI